MPVGLRGRCVASAESVDTASQVVGECFSAGHATGHVLSPLVHPAFSLSLAGDTVALMLVFATKGNDDGGTGVDGLLRFPKHVLLWGWCLYTIMERLYNDAPTFF